MAEAFQFGGWYSQGESGGGSEGTGGAVGDEEVGQVRGGQVVEGFEGEEEYLEVDALFNGEPVERVKNGSDVIAGPGVGKEAGSRVLDQLESMEGLGGDASEKGVAIVEAGGDEGVDEGFGSRGREAVSDFGDAAEVEVGGLDYGADMGIKGEGGVQDNAEIACQWGGSDGRGVDGE